MKTEARADTAESQMSVLEILRDRSLRWQIYTVCVIQIGQPLTGINAVRIYDTCHDSTLFIFDASVYHKWREFILHVSITSAFASSSVAEMQMETRTERIPLPQCKTSFTCGLI